MTNQGKNHQHDQGRQNNEDRDRQILNILCNVSILLMATLTEAVSGLFSTLSTEMIGSLAKSFGATEQDTKTLDEVQKKLPQAFRDELLTIKNDITRQLNEKRTELEPFLADPRFDTGIRIAQRNPSHVPRLTDDLDDHSLLTCLALLQANDPEFTRMFQQLLEWMNTLPQPEKKEQ